MSERVYDWKAEGDFAAVPRATIEQPQRIPYPKEKVLKLGLAATLLALLVSPKGHPEHYVSPNQAYLQAATLEGPETTIQELDGENFGTGIACYVRSGSHKDAIAYDTRPSVTPTEQHPLKYLLVSNGKDNRFDATIEPSLAEFYRVLVRVTGDRVQVHSFDMFDYDHKYDEYHNAKLKSGQAYFGSYAAEKFAVTRKGNDFYMVYSCDDGYMRRWVGIQNEFANQSPVEYFFDPTISPAERLKWAELNEEFGTVETGN